VISSVDVQKHNVMAHSDTMEWDFDLKHTWLTKSRWSMMARQYIDPEELEIWMKKVTGRIGTRGRGIAMLRTKEVKARGGAATGHTNKETRRWGSCMLALSYKAIPAPQITLYSRTSYLGYIGALDLTVAWMASRYIGEELGLSPSAFQFVWFNEAIQWHNFKSLAYVLNHPDVAARTEYRRLLIKPESKLSEAEITRLHSAPALELSRKWLRKVMKEDAEGKTYGDMTYNTYRRIRRRWHTEVLGYARAQTFEGWSYHKRGDHIGEQKEYFKAYAPLPSVPVSTLDFSPLGFPLGRQYGEPFDAALAAQMEDDDDD